MTSFNIPPQHFLFQRNKKCSTSRKRFSRSTPQKYCFVLQIPHTSWRQNNTSHLPTSLLRLEKCLVAGMVKYSNSDADKNITRLLRSRVMKEMELRTKTNRFLSFQSLSTLFAFKLRFESFSLKFGACRLPSKVSHMCMHSIVSSRNQTLYLS